MSRVLVRKADIVYDVMSGRPQLQVGVGARRDREGRRMMPTFGGERNLVAVQDALQDREARAANIEDAFPVDEETGFRSSQNEKEFQHAMGQLGSGFASDQERFAYAAPHQGESGRFDAARRGAGIGGRVGQGLGALGTSLVGVMSGLSALEGGQGPLAAGLTGYTAAQQLGGMMPYLTEAGMRAGAGLGARMAPTNTSSTVAVAEPTMNNVNTTGSVNPNLITSYGGASAGGPAPIGVVPAERVDRRERRAAEPTAPTTAEAAGSTLASYLGDSPNESAPAEGLAPPNPRTAAEAAVPQTSLSAPDAGDKLGAYLDSVKGKNAGSHPGGY